MRVTVPGFRRKCKDGYLVDYMLYAYGDPANPSQESPEEFHLWCGVSTVSIALGRSVWLNRGKYTLYPNLYVILVAGSALCRKSTALSLAERVMKRGIPDFHAFSQKATSQAMISYLATRYSETGISQGVIIHDEISNLLGNKAQNRDIIDQLTQWYNCPIYWDYQTITRGTEECHRVVVNMLGATTPDGVRASLDESSIGGGFTSRIIFIHRDAPDIRVPFPEDTDREASDNAFQRCVHDLGLIWSLQGEFTWTTEAKEYFRDWYLNVFNPDTMPVQLRGYVGRKHDLIMKVAMIASASRDDSLRITLADIRFAVQLIQDNEPHMMRALDLIIESEEGKLYEKIIGFIQRKGEVTHSRLLRAFHKIADSEAIQKALITGLETGVLEARVAGRSRLYRYVPTAHYLRK